MPELPEVETIARTLRPQILGRRLQNVSILRDKTLEGERGLLEALEGARVSGVLRRGKLLLIELEDRQGLPLLAAFHLKMTGQLFVHPPGVAPNKHTKITAQLYPAGPGGAKKDGGPEGQLFFDDMRCFGYCRLLRPEELDGWKFYAALGPEPLEHSPEELAARLAARKGRIKGLLLDQTVIAGIGNIYADEALFRAGIRPDRKMEELLAEAAPGKGKGKNAKIPPCLVCLGREVQEVLKESIEACGSSIRDYRDAEGKAGAFQNSFKVYGRGGENCQSCGRALEQTRVAGRGTTFCPHCQK